MTRSPLRRLPDELLIFWSLLILHLAPVVIFPFIPTQDGPGHQAVASILRQYDQPSARLLREYFRPNTEALPNRFIFFMMDALLGGFPVPVAEKILLGLYVLLLPLSIRYAVRAVRPEAAYLSLLAFPFLFNFTFQMGFFNFCFSLPAFFLAVGYWLKHQEELTPPRVIVLALLVLWVYFCHPVTLVVTVTTLGTLALWRAILEGRASGHPGLAARRWLLGPVLASVPALVLMASFVHSRAGARISALPLWVKLKHLAGLYTLASVSRWTIPLAALLSLLFFAAFFRALKLRGRRPPMVADGLLLVVGVLLVAYLASPSELSGGGFITHRLNLFPFLAVLLWLATFDLPEVWTLGLQVSAVMLSMGFLTVYVGAWSRLDDGLSRILGVGRAIEPDHTLLFLSFAHQGEGEAKAFRTDPFVHAGGYVAARKRLVDLSLYQANEDYFPIYYAPRLNPYTRMSTAPLGIETQPPRVDLLGYMRKSGARVDYVLVWGLRGDQEKTSAARGLREALARAYEPVEATPDGDVRLYRFRGINHPGTLARGGPLR